jgi:hypothetical protein
MSIDSRELGVLRRIERVWDTPFLGAGEVGLLCDFSDVLGASSL